MESKKIYTFTEENEWEGETWHFYIKLTEEDAERFKKALDCESCECYTLEDENITEEEAINLSKHSRGGYMATYNYVGDIKLPKVLDENVLDRLYKGGLILSRVFNN